MKLRLGQDWLIQSLDKTFHDFDALGAANQQQSIRLPKCRNADGALPHGIDFFVELRDQIGHGLAVDLLELQDLHFRLGFFTRLFNLADDLDDALYIPFVTYTMPPAWSSSSNGEPNGSRPGPRRSAGGRVVSRSVMSIAPFVFLQARSNACSRTDVEDFARTACCLANIHRLRHMERRYRFRAH